jgi:hypothetical protein
VPLPASVAWDEAVDPLLFEQTPLLYDPQLHLFQQRPAVFQEVKCPLLLSCHNRAGGMAIGQIRIQPNQHLARRSERCQYERLIKTDKR